jgi:hypothetical protein
MFRTDAKCDIEAGEALSDDNYGKRRDLQIQQPDLSACLILGLCKT